MFGLFRFGEPYLGQTSETAGNIVQGSGNAIGTATATGSLTGTIQAAGAASGSATATGTGSKLQLAFGDAVGFATASGTASEAVIINGAGNAVGLATATGSSIVRRGGAGVAIGFATALGSYGISSGIQPGGDFNVEPAESEIEFKPRFRSTSDWAQKIFTGTRRSLLPIIITQPQSGSVVVESSSSFSFSVGAIGDLPLHYQWILNHNPLVNGGNISGANTPVLTINPVLQGNIGNYSVRVSNTFGFADSLTATLSAIAIDLDAIDWVNRVIANGGARPSGDTVTALSAFIIGLKDDSLWAKMKCLNFFAPDNLIACLTPLIVGLGHDPWINHLSAFTTANLSTDGLETDGLGSQFLDTGFNPVGNLIGTNMGLSWMSKSDAGLETVGMCIVSQSSFFHFSLMNTPTESKAGLFGFLFVQDFSVGTTNNIGIRSHGFLSASRIGGSASLYQKSTSGGSSSVVGSPFSNPIPNASVLVFVGVGPVTVSAGVRCSFVAIHEGLNSTETDNLYSRLQTLRTALGGGAV
jgi:hypothetical protein